MIKTGVEIMLKGLGRDVRTAAISVLAASIVVAVPAAAATVANADKVDGKHAASASSTVQTRAGKLVATGGNGYLPNNILLKALDSDRLDGKHASEFLAANGQAADANLLDGKDSTEFLGATDKAGDANLLDGKDSAEFLGANAKATDADKLDNLDSSGYWKKSEEVAAATATSAGNADTVDGRHATGILAKTATAQSGSMPYLDPSNVTSYLVVQITAPVAGTVQAEGVATLVGNHVYGTASWFRVSASASNTAMGGYTGSGQLHHPSSMPSGYIRNTVPLRETFGVVAGTHTYYLVGIGSSNMQFDWAKMDLTFIPS